MIPSGKRLIVVLGMHRSGTSTITRAFNVLGVDLGDRLLPPVQVDNAKGYFEDIDLNALNIEMLHALGSDWHCLAPIEPSDVERLHQKGYFLRAVVLLRQKTAKVSIFGFKDPRVAKLLPFWHPVFVYCGFDTGYVLVIRNPLSVAQSLAKRAGFSPEKSYALWLGHVLTSLLHTEEHRRVLVDYDHFLHAPQQDLELIAERLALQIDPQALQHYQSEFLDEGLRHTEYEANDLALDQTCLPLVQELYAELIDVSRDNKQLDNPTFHTRTALWDDEFNRFKLNLRWIDNLSVQIANLNQSIKEHDGEITNLIKTALEQDQNIFQKSFDPEWYLKKYPDVATAGVDPYQHYIHHGVPEGRIPSVSPITFIRDALIDHSKEFNVQLNQTKLLEAQLLHLAEREQAYLAQLALAQQKLETQQLHLAEREKTYTQQLLQIQQTHDEQSCQQAEHVQALYAQLLAGRDELQNLTNRWTETDKAQALAITQLHRELDAMRTTYSWRWTAPLRSLAALLGKKDSGSFISTPSMVNTEPTSDPFTQLVIPGVETPSPLTPIPSNTNDMIVHMPLNHISAAAATLEELLSRHDERFIHSAYHTLLGRAPDPEGMRYYLARVRAGISKVEVLAQLRLSTEGKSRKVKIAGLNEAIKRHQQLKLPLIGALLRLAGVREVGLGEDSTFTYPSELEPKPYDPIGERYQAALTEISSRLKRPADEFSTMLEKVKISILMPVYKVPLPFLEKAIESVQYQTYANWELCIVDDGSNDVELAEYLHEIARKDCRIKLEIATNNRGIAGATNAAISMATGDFLAFLDNDDMLTHDALHCIASAIQSHPNVDLVYSDECKIDEHDVPVELFTKPDWSPCTLINCMYTGHLSVYRKSIVEQVGCMRSEYDFSQDYDLALRVSEITSRVRHVDRILYGWRMIAGSGAQGDKPYARATNIAALQDAAIRRGISGEAVAEPTANHLRVSLAAMTQKVSIVIPSDNLKNIQNTIDTINANTRYQNYEIIVVTNSGLIKALIRKNLPSGILLVPFDQEFNFSAKCNVGAKQASGDIIVFFNDDVRVVSKDWIEMILECFFHPGVGIVGPKLLYENHLIQHAGMVTGVRGLVGTAFHCLPHETSKHFGAAQWMREVSLICGACLAIRSDVFELVDGFDAVNAPISHSDVDLCFRVRDAGYTCLYTPHATLIHIGHMSIGETEKAEALKHVVRKKDKSDIFLLRQWGHHTSYDPYFPPAMRDILYHDSPETWQLHANVPPAPAGGKDVLLISHDLSGSGAPRIVFEMARVLRDAGHFVVVASPADGVYRERLNAIGVPVIIDELLLRQHPSLERLAKNFDLVIANTVVTWPTIKLLGEAVETYWYIHEISLLQNLLNIQPEIKDAFPLAKRVWVGSDHAAALVLPHRPDAVILKYGVKPLGDVKDELAIGRLPLSVSLFGSYELRKGQDLAIAAFAALPPEYRSKLRLNLFGRVLDENLFHTVELAARGLHEVTIKTEIPYEQYIEELLASHAILVASRDDTLPFVSIDALGAGKVLMCTNTTGTSSYIEHGVSGFISTSPEPQAIAAMLREVIDRASELPTIGLNGRKVFNAEFSASAFTSAFLNACGITDNKH